MKKILLIAAGAALIFKDQLAELFAEQTAAADTPTTGTAADPLTAQQAAQAQVLPGALALTKEAIRQLHAAAVARGGEPADGLMTWDHWAYYYAAVRGTSAPGWTPEIVGGRSREYRMTLDEWYTFATAAGLSGLRIRPAAPKPSAVWGAL